MDIERKELLEKFFYEHEFFDGFNGCGLTKDGILALVRSDQSAAAFPSEFMGVPVQIHITGGLKPL